MLEVAAQTQYAQSTDQSTWNPDLLIATRQIYQMGRQLSWGGQILTIEASHE